MIKILFLGDINGKIGREAVKKLLPKLKREYKPDLVIANGENMAHGTGFTEATIKELMEAGVDFFTGGDHAFDKEKQVEGIYGGYFPIIRPANYPLDVPGKGYAEIDLKKGGKILLINLLGRVFMQMDYDCPFRKLDEILANKDLAGNNYSAILIDIHAEATSEKIALGHYADGRVAVMLGTHTHVQTADAKITDKGMAYLTDIGMVGAADECIGVQKEGIIKTFLTQVKRQHVIPEKGKAILNAALVEINTKTKKTTNIKPITKFIEIK